MDVNAPIACRALCFIFVWGLKKHLLFCYFSRTPTSDPHRTGPWSEHKISQIMGRVSSFTSSATSILVVKHAYKTNTAIE